MILSIRFIGINKIHNVVRTITIHFQTFNRLKKSSVNSVTIGQ